MIEALKIQVRGIVQGVGFRPFIYRLAKKYLITGWVLNAADGVTIHAEGEASLLDEFVLEISENAPAASQIDEIEMHETILEDFDSFEIRFSDEGAVEKTTLVSPDLATCNDCRNELFDPQDRRYRYPFINCTNCGPRFTIIDALPYDRKSTSMRDFPMCPDCNKEYNDPLDRRFHAQPDACFECGPHISWRESHSDSVLWGRTRPESDEIFKRAIDFLRQGKILAVKGLGGFHLVCDAENENAVAELRRRKKREGKPFAVMMKDVDQVRSFCAVNEAEERVLQGAQRPIVLLKKRKDIRLVAGLADKLTELGVMLPYTPIQQILLHDHGGVLVMTSGNIHDEPIVTDDDEAFAVLQDVADAFLGHNRSICARYDDSVVRLIKIGNEEFSLQCIRRARGYAPIPLPLELMEQPKEPTGSVFATGPEQKNSFCLTREEEAFVSQHIGDMENAETFDSWLEAKRRYEKLFEITPTLLACDMHPEYLTSKWAHEQDIPVVEVQHHFAHILSVMGENKLEAPVAGIAFDGTGYGVDKAIWGGEVLLCNYEAFERFANFTYIPMPGGAAAIKHPLRMLYGALWAFDLLDHPAASEALSLLGETADICGKMIEKGLNTPYTSSVGRLFDAASALLGICTEPLYEGEGAVLLEAAIAGDDPHEGSSIGSELPQIDGGNDAYEIELVKNTATTSNTAQDTSVILFDAASAFKSMLDDKQAGVAKEVIARRFHDAFVKVIVDSARMIELAYGIRTIALSGGVFMNRYVIEHAVEALANEGFTVALNRDLPPNDGCISFGQAILALSTENRYK